MHSFDDISRLIEDHDNTGDVSRIKCLSSFFEGKTFNIYDVSEALGSHSDSVHQGKVVVPAGCTLPLKNFVLNSHRNDKNDLFVFFSIPTGKLVFHVNGQSHVFVNASNKHLNMECRLRRRSSFTVICPDATCNGATLINDNSMFVLGRDSMVSDEVIFQCSDQHGVIDVENMNILNGQFSHISIGDHCWVGRRALISKNVTLGSGAIVAAGAVVTKSFDGYCAIGGNPATVIKQRCSWCREPEKVSARERRLLESLLEMEH